MLENVRKRALCAPNLTFFEAVAAMVVALAIAGCGDPGTEPGAGPDGLDRARAFEGYTLYYAGDALAGDALEFAGRGPGSGLGVRRSWSFIYGDCTPPAGEGGCAPPHEIQNWSICARSPALYRTPALRTSTINGAETLRVGGGGLDVYTGRTTVVIFGGDGASVVPLLRRVSDGAAPEALPPPAPGALEGKLPCQNAARLQREHG
jgi:hypothetical protein